MKLGVGTKDDKVKIIFHSVLTDDDGYLLSPEEARALGEMLAIRANELADYLPDD